MKINLTFFPFSTSPAGTPMAVNLQRIKFRIKEQKSWKSEDNERTIVAKRRAEISLVIPLSGYRHTNARGRPTLTLRKRARKADSVSNVISVANESTLSRERKSCGSMRYACIGRKKVCLEILPRKHLFFICATRGSMYCISICSTLKIIVLQKPRLVCAGKARAVIIAIVLLMFSDVIPRDITEFYAAFAC